MLSPNKQNLLLLKSQSKVIQNGLKLLREKRAGLVVMLLDFASKGKKMEKEVQEQWSKFKPTYTSATAMVSLSELVLNFEPLPVMNLKVDKKRVSGVYLEILKIVLQPPKRLGLKKTINTTLMNFGIIFPIILKLNETKINCRKIADEIEKTNRQINNLESKVEDVNMQIKYIATALNERASHEKATLIKIFG